MDFQQIVEAISTLGTLGFALIALWALVREWVVPKSRLDEQRADKKEAMDLAREAIASSDRANDAAERVAKAVEEKNRLDAAREQAERELAARELRK